MKQFVKLIVLLSFISFYLTGCSSNTQNKPKLKNIELNQISDENVQLIFFDQIINKKNCKISIGLTPTLFPNYEQHLMLIFSYEDLPEMYANENLFLELDVKKIDGKDIKLIYKFLPLQSDNQIKTLNSMSMGGKNRIFLIKKTEYTTLSNAQKISFKVVYNDIKIEGKVHNEDIKKLKKYENKFLNFKGFDVTHAAVKIFRHLALSIISINKLKKAETRDDLLNHFKMNKDSQIYNSETNAFEEDIFIDFYQQPSQKIIIGFDSNEKILYDRDDDKKSQIRWR